MSCPPGYREVTGLKNGALIVSCVPIIGGAEQCSDSEFYRQLTGLPPCSGQGSGTAPASSPGSSSQSPPASSSSTPAPISTTAPSSSSAPGFTPNPNVARVLVLGVGLVLIILALVLMQSSQGTDFIGSAGRAGRARFQAMRKNNAE